MIEDIKCIEKLKRWLKESCSDEPPDNRVFEIGKQKIQLDPIRAVFIVVGSKKVYFQEDVRQALSKEEHLNHLVYDMLKHGSD